jgi:hypothetical protein
MVHIVLVNAIIIEICFNLKVSESLVDGAMGLSRRGLVSLVLFGSGRKVPRPQFACRKRQMKVIVHISRVIVGRILRRSKYGFEGRCWDSVLFLYIRPCCNSYNICHESQLNTNLISQYFANGYYHHANKVTRGERLFSLFSLLRSHSPDARSDSRSQYV